MSFFNSEVLGVSNGQVLVDIGHYWSIPLAQWNRIPGSKPPAPGQYWAIEVSSVANLLAGEMPRSIQRTNDVLDGMDDYFADVFGGRSR
ncbi:MAG: hypothetical protein WA939_05610 [Nodosilinea sp.]